MRTWAAVIVVVGVVSGCEYGQIAFHCDPSHDCGGGATCEANGFCSVDDPSCGPSGRRFTDHSGGLSGTCVGGGLPIDSGTNPPDAPPDARVCFGTGLVKVCFTAPPTVPRAFSDSTPIDTMNPSNCATTVSGASNYCVIVATTITVDAKLRVTGAKPLVLIASDTITTGAQIDVGSHRGQTPETGAGADPSSCNPGTAPTNGGGGAGGSFTGPGGAGGNGNGAASGGGIPGAVAPAPTDLHGGCPGQDGQALAANDRGLHGHGGGAVFLIAGVKLDIQGGINAAGESGTAGSKNSSGGGGGGAGGMIGLDAPTIMVTSLILANGGGGGEGSGTGSAGANGNDPTTIAAAGGGGGASAVGGDGGDGSAGVAAGPGAAGNSGTGGGGGGGGGAGLVKAPAGASLGTLVSPAATP